MRVRLNRVTFFASALLVSQGAVGCVPSSPSGSGASSGVKLGAGDGAVSSATGGSSPLGGTGGGGPGSGGAGATPATGGATSASGGTTGVDAGPGQGGSGGASSGSGGSGSGGMNRGGASTDGGAMDLPAVGGTTGQGGGAGGGCAGIFCEDFEKGSIDPTIWDIKLNGGQPTPNVVSQAGLAAHGKYAAHFHANPNVKSYDVIITKNAPVALRGHHFGRAYFMITPMPPANHTQYIYAGTTGFPQYRYLEVASAGNNSWQLTYVDLVPPTTGEDYHSGGQVPLGKWSCLEWEFNDAPDQASVYVDGKLEYAANTFTFGGATTGLVGGFAAFGFGYYAWHPATYPFDIYYDDIVLDTKRVGCL